MKILINGNYFTSTQTDEFFRRIDQNTYNSLGEAVSDKLNTAIQNTQWYHHTPPKSFDLFQNFNDVQSYCRDNVACYMDAMNWSIMNKTELTADIYKFITHRVSVVKEGFAHHFLPSDAHILNFIDWHFILDCISWFI